ncbi:MAG: glycosyltransferase [Pirellulaceae bacterium]|nr:glycosyltransferase [Pirellulaceae bacterium]
MSSRSSLTCLHFSESVDVELGGVVRSILDLVHALDRHGVSTILASPYINAATAQISDSIQSHVLPSGKLLIESAKHLIARSDIVHLHTPWWTTNLWLMDEAFKLKKPVVLSSHGMLDQWSMNQKRLKKKAYLKFFAERRFAKCTFHCTAVEERRQVLEQVRPISAEVVPLVIDKRYFEGKLHPDPALAEWPFLRTHRMKLLFLSRLHPKKSIDVAIRSLAHLPDCLLVVAGAGDPKYVNSLKQLSVELGVASRIHWLGSVHGDIKDSLLACCDCMVLPTQQENFGLVQIEGLSMGMKVISTYGTDVWQELKRCGAMIVDRTPEAFADAVNQCSTDQQEREARQKTQRARLLEWLDPDATTRQYIALYQKCIEAASSKRKPSGVARQNIVLHTISSLGIDAGGPSESIPSLCQNLNRLENDWSACILTKSVDARNPRADLSCTEVEEVPSDLSASQLYRRAKQKIVDLSPGLIHDHGQWLPMNHASAIAARTLGVPRIVSPRGMLSPWSRNHKRWKKRIAWWLYARADLSSATMLHATSELELKELRDFGCKQPIAMIPNGVKFSEANIYAKAEPPYVLFLSRIHPKKGIKELLEVWEKIRPESWELKIAGPDADSYLKTLGLSNRPGVQYLGMVQGEKKARLLGEASLFVLPSYSENFGIVVAEALMAKTPVIATKGTPWKIVEDHQCGWWIEMTSQSLERQLRLAMELPAEALRAMGERGHEMVKRTFAWPKIADEMSHVYRWMLSGDSMPSCVRILEKQ